MLNVGDKVTILPIDELDVESCCVCEDDVYGIGNEVYETFIGKAYTISEVDTCSDSSFYELLEDTDYGFKFPVGCLKKL